MTDNTFSIQPDKNAVDVQKPLDRRSFLLASGVLATAVFSGSPQAKSAQPVPDAPGVEGFFLVFDEGQEPDRIFFIPSRWLEVFEVTDLYDDRTESKKVADKIRVKGPKARLYYGDIPVKRNPVPGAMVLAPETPDATKTYIAAMVADTNVQ
jgi:hypothetical protein